MNRLFSILLLAIFATASLLSAADEAPPELGIPPGEEQPIEGQIFRVSEMVAGADWGVLKLNAPAAWKVTKGKGVRVAVLDTGVDVNHPDLAPRIADPADLKDFSNSPFGVVDKQGHGTHCAGSVLASGPLPGCAPEASLIVAKVLGDKGSGGVDGIAKGIRWSVSRNADIISMSLGGPRADSFIPPALAEAEAAGVIVFAAAGNEGPGANTVGFPGGYPLCVTVGAVDTRLNTANFSSRGSAVFVAAPGVNIRSTYPGGQYATMSGTSMATPNLAGVCALWIAAHPEIAKVDRPKAWREALKNACTDLPPNGRDVGTGWGFPDAAKLVAGSVTPPLPPAPLNEIRFGPSDFTATGLAKLRALNPKLDGFAFPIKP